MSGSMSDGGGAPDAAGEAPAAEAASGSASAASAAPAAPVVVIPDTVSAYYRRQILEKTFVPHDTAKVERMTVKYCEVCGLPPDFCMYGPCWEKCKPWCIENVPYLYPELGSVSLDDAKKGAAEAAEQSKVKLLPGGKKKREASPSVQIKKLTRGGRKCVTSIQGLELFDVKLEAAAKTFKKKFACGSAVVKGDNGLPDCIEIQGDVGPELAELLVDEFGVPEDKVHAVEGGTKRKGKK